MIKNFVCKLFNLVTAEEYYAEKKAVDRLITGLIKIGSMPGKNGSAIKARRIANKVLTDWAD